MTACEFYTTSGGTGDFVVSAATPGHFVPEDGNVIDGKTYTYYAQSFDKAVPPNVTAWEAGSGPYTISNHPLQRATLTANSNGDLDPVDFPTPPVVGVYASPSSSLESSYPDALSFNNLVINGNADVSQELWQNLTTAANGVAKYTADCIQTQYSHAANTAVITCGQLPVISFPVALAGYNNAHQVKATTALSAPANGDYALHRWIVEGYRIARLRFGSASAQAFAYGFQFYSTVAGTIFIRFAANSYVRCFYREHAVSACWN